MWGPWLRRLRMTGTIVMEGIGEERGGWGVGSASMMHSVDGGVGLGVCVCVCMCVGESID